ncbi:uncharacterized protein [Triticum aestivum]|uniref:uncharacterized protein isoform X2 n=1 Tax=Triticum aestivum TaxID=4565 RepID=UPI0008437980|nr:uncharacterized protein LOC123090860 isoform X2 [Triticum aestivum]XP_044368165.1 uncharacterized protein LOC123090860 isoform X2 [Triticum aestivum]
MSMIFTSWSVIVETADYAVVEKPCQITWMKGGLDYIVLKSLDADGIHIISSVPGQSIGLDHYIRQVDDMVEEFTETNLMMEKTGDFTMKIKKLFRLMDVSPPTPAKAARHCRRKQVLPHCFLTPKTEASPLLSLCAPQTCIDPQFFFHAPKTQNVELNRLLEILT